MLNGSTKSAVKRLTNYFSVGRDIQQNQSFKKGFLMQQDIKIQKERRSRAG
jgi:hypothetical protein